MKLDKEEKAILAAYKKGLLKTVSPSKAELKEIKATAKNTCRKKISKNP